MKIPSLRTQFILFSILFIFFTGSIFRYFVLNSFDELDEKMTNKSTSEEIRNLIINYSDNIEDSLKNSIENQGRKILNYEKQKELAFSFFKRDIIWYSGILLFSLVFIWSIFLLIIANMITQPINQLLNATNELAQGNTNLKIKNYPFSPINPLIISFNNMIKDLELSRKQLIKAEKELLWKEMARVLAHEIKNPITTIKLTLDRLKRKYDEKSNLIEIFIPSYNVINEEIVNLNRLASEFSQFAKLPKSKFEITNLSEFINKIKTGYLEELNINFNDNNEYLVQMDSMQMRQVFNNLIKNSIEAKATQIKIEINNENDKIKLSLSDNGMGIEKEQLLTIFEPYFTLKRSGTGLGLAIVKQIIEQHNAEILVESEIGIGTTFHIYFNKIK